MSKSMLLDKMNAKSEAVEKAHDVLQGYYGGSIRPIFISDIIKGESIETKPENILISEQSIDPEVIKYIDETLAERCTKTLYKYQRDALVKLRELELKGTNKDVISNGWLLSLPIGSGKSLVFQSLVILFPTVPPHPIIISIDGKNCPDHEQIPWKSYPYSYEVCGYVKGERNAVIVCDEYKQRQQTVILTHLHLIEQMREYFAKDFPNYQNYVNIRFALKIREIQDFNSADIIVIPADEENVDILVSLSCNMPFTRVIVDDYTSMSFIESFREIRASSTIFVSGSGFDRADSDIPASYYTLKYAPTPKLTLVGKPEETYVGVFRDNIVTSELIGGACRFSQYRFVEECENVCSNVLGRVTPEMVYPPIATEPFLRHYMSLMFILTNFGSIQQTISMVEEAMATVNTKTGKPILDRTRLPYYMDWKKMLADTARYPPKSKKVKVINKATGKATIETRFEEESLNPLYRLIYNKDVAIGKTSRNDASNKPLEPNPICMSCGEDASSHDGFGALARCCGAFYCNKCLRNMCTHRIIDAASGSEVTCEDKYYCLSCREENPTYFFNTARKKDSHAITMLNLAEEYFDTSMLSGCDKFDYYFYMFANGFKPLYIEGPPINVSTDIQLGHMTLSQLKSKTLVIEKIIPTDQLAVSAIDAINETLSVLRIFPRRRPIILFFACPSYMRQRVRSQYDSIILQNDSSTALKIEIRKKIEYAQPIKGCSLMFVDNISEIIGLHENILGIVEWEPPSESDSRRQLLGRIMRLNAWSNKIYFFITTSSSRYA